MLIPNSVTIAVGTAAGTTANRVLAAGALVNRWVRAVYATNTTAAAIDLSVGMGVAATLSASNADIASAAPIPAKATSYPVAQYAGQGKKGLGVGSLNEIMAFASGAGLLLTVIYSDDTLA
jgi:hypothetical protein